MSQRVRFTHRELSSGQHAILSPDIKGFCVVGAPGDSRWDVEHQALECLTLLQQRNDTIPRGLPAMEPKTTETLNFQDNKKAEISAFRLKCFRTWAASLGHNFDDWLSSEGLLAPQSTHIPSSKS